MDVTKSTADLLEDVERVSAMFAIKDGRIIIYITLNRPIHNDHFKCPVETTIQTEEDP